MAFRKQSLKRTLVCFSALLAVAAFLFPFYCAECIFIFLVPLLYLLFSNTSSITYKDGLLWGTVFYLLFFIDIYLLILHKGFGLIKVAAILFLFTYSICIVLCWFFIAQLLCSYCPKENRISKIACWGFATYLYGVFIETSFFFIFGSWEGNSLHHFIIPLAIRYQWIYYIGLVGTNIFFFFIIMVNIFITITLAHKKYLYASLVLFFCALLFYAAEWLQDKKLTQQPWFNKFGCIALQTSTNNPIDAAEKIMHAFHAFQEQFPECVYIVMPESSFSFPLNMQKKYISLWESPSKMVFIGAHRYENNSLYNTLYCIYDGSIIDYYDKMHCMFFTETIPTLWSSIPGADTLFLSNKQPFVAGTTKKSLEIPAIGCIKPLICSDLFFNYAKLESDQIYLCIVNDSWFAHGYIPNLMFLHAKVVASLKNSIIIYCAYRHCVLITAQGNCLSLPTFSL